MSLSPTFDQIIRANLRKINDTWKRRFQLEPSVALAALNTVSNLCLAVAIANGVAIAWWRRAMRGASIQQLHNSWSFSTSTLELVTAGKKFNLIAMTALTAKIALVDNVLLQRSTSTFATTYTQYDVSNKLPLVSEPPAGWFGDFNVTDGTWYPSFQFAEDLYTYTTRGDYRSFDIDASGYSWDAYKDVNSAEKTYYNTGCYGQCNAQAPGFGFNVSCSAIIEQTRAQVNSSFKFNETSSEDAIAYQPELTGTPVDNILGSFLSFYEANQNITIPSVNGSVNQTFPQATIVINTKWAVLTDTEDVNGVSSQNCNAVIKYRQCIMTPAKVNYTITIDDIRNPPEGTTTKKQATLASKNGLPSPVTTNGVTYQGVGDAVLSEAQISEGNLGGAIILGPAYSPWDNKYNGNIGAIYAGLQSFFQAYVSLRYENATGFVPSSQAASMMTAWWTSYSANRFDQRTCVMQLRDPMPYIINAINSIMFRSSISAAFTGGNSSDIKFTPAHDTTFTAFYVSAPSTGYVSDYNYLIAACVCMFVCFLLVLPSYWGFWELGRKVTLGPVEVASAFQAPVLQRGEAGAPGGGEVKALLEVVGGRRVKYGQAEDGRLVVAESHAVASLPKAGPTLKIAGHTL